MHSKVIYVLFTNFHIIFSRGCVIALHIIFLDDGGRGEGEKFGLRLLMASIKIESLEWSEKSFFYDCVH
jgi:hypothetical protein